MKALINYNSYLDQTEYIDYLRQNAPNLSYNIITYGCQMNEHDSENLSGILNDIGYKQTLGREDADIIIFNTCAVRENAEERFFGNAGALKNLSKLKNKPIICVCGCMMQEKSVVEKIISKLKHIDIIFGTHNIYKLPELLCRFISESRKTQVVDVQDIDGQVIEGLPQSRKYGFKAFVNIMYGCNNFCSYCIVPYTRGRERSRLSKDIIAEIKKMAESGVKEVMLLGQNVNSYGNGFDSSYSFSDLLYDVSKIDGLERIRFMTSHPKDLSDDIIYAVRDIDKVCSSIHLPVQSGSNRILKAMNRKYTAEKYLSILEKIKTELPNAGLTTDIIVGFPGETEEDFQDTIDLVKKAEYDSAFIFHYSPRIGTPASKMAGLLDEESKKSRFDRLLNTVNDIANLKNKKYLNTIQKVLVEGLSKNNKNTYAGRNEQNKLINFEDSKNRTGEFINVKITKTNSFSLYGKALDI